MSPRPELLVYKEIVAGDLRKFAADSNDSKTGGGARDLRLPWKPFRSIMHRIFTREAIGRGGQRIRIADVTYLDEEGRAKHTELSYWPATTARPSEDRIAQVHASPAIGGQSPKTDRGRVFLLLIKFDDDMIRCVYAYEHDLRRDNVWAREVSAQILGCLSSSLMRTRPSTTMGYYDFVEGTGYCHADGR